MCYYKRKTDKTVLTAKTDITVYKIVRQLTGKGFKSYYENFQYILGKTYKTKFNEYETLHSTKMYKGFHSYKEAKYTDKCYATGKKMKTCGRSLDLRRKNDTHYGSFIIKCVIPKGTKYWFNGVDYVSEALKAVSVIQPPKGHETIIPKLFKGPVNKK